MTVRIRNIISSGAGVAFAAALVVSGSATPAHPVASAGTVASQEAQSTHVISVKFDVPNCAHRYP